MKYVREDIFFSLWQFSDQVSALINVMRVVKRLRPEFRDTGRRRKANRQDFSFVNKRLR